MVACDLPVGNVFLARPDNAVGLPLAKCCCVLPSRGMVTAKASISSFFMHFRKGDDVWFRGWCYLSEGGKMPRLSREAGSVTMTQSVEIQGLEASSR